MTLDAWERALAATCVEPHVGVLPKAAHEALASTLTEFGSSRFSALRKCGYAHHLQWAEQVIPLCSGPSLDADYFGLGILVHACLAYVWDGSKLGGPRDWRDILKAASVGGTMQQALHDETERLVSAYFGHWGAEDFHAGEVRIVDVEREFTDSDSFALPYTARLDLVVEVAGTIFVVDTKTRATAFPKNDRRKYQRGLRTRSQFLGQSHLARRGYGLDYAPQVIVNGIIKTKIPGFDRMTAEVTEADVLRWAVDHSAWAAEGLGDRKRNYSHCAPDMGAPCSFLEYCHGSAETRARHFTTKSAARAAVAAKKAAQ